MGTRAMKQDVFTIKALESKGFDMKKILEMSDAEIDALPLAQKLISGIKEYRARGGKTIQQITEEIVDIMVRESSEIEDDSTIAQYKNNTVEQQAMIEEIQSSVVIPEDEVQIIRTESSQEDVDTIVQVLKEKEFKSFAPYLKHLKSAVPAQILTSVDGTKVNELIEIRIAEVKAKDESTK